MKAIKLILLFIAVLGCIVGFFFLSGGSGEGGIEVADADQIQKYRNECKKAWQRNQDWNEETFLKYHDLASQSKNTQLKDLNTSKAITITKNKIFAQWHSSDCHHDSIQKYLDAIKTIKSKDSNAKNNVSVKEIEKVDSVYQVAYTFVNDDKQYKIYPSLTGSNYDFEWTKFSDHSKVKKINQQKKDIIENPDYTEHLSNIDEINSGLNDVPNKLKNSEETYYNKLAEKIINKFKSIPSAERTLEQSKKLGDLQYKFDEEFITENEKLDKFVEEFEKDVYNNEEAKKSENNSDIDWNFN